MGKHLWVEEDQFAAALGEILGDIADASDEALFKCVHDALSEGRDEWKSGAPRRKGSGKYAKSITYRALRKKHGVEGHIYSRKPGFPHLLEKGHAKIGGGRTAAQEHVMPAAQLAFRYVRERLPEYIARELT